MNDVVKKLLFISQVPQDQSLPSITKHRNCIRTKVYKPILLHTPHKDYPRIPYTIVFDT